MNKPNLPEKIQPGAGYSFAVDCKVNAWMFVAMVISITTDLFYRNEVREWPSYLRILAAVATLLAILLWVRRLARRIRGMDELHRSVTSAACLFATAITFFLVAAWRHLSRLEVFHAVFPGRLKAYANVNLCVPWRIHGRATAVASGLKATRPELSVWIITGDGDALSIGGNHFIHMLRRNFNVNVLLFNNQIYGLTKGQYSPTSEEGKITKSTPYGSLDHPFNPIALAMGADGTYIARSMDRDPVHLKDTLRKANAHKGTSFVEIYQNCNVFNDGAFEIFTEKSSKKIETLMVENGKPFIFGANNEKGIKLDGFKPVIVDLTDGNSANDLWVHDETDRVKAGILSRFFDNPAKEGHFPRPFGVFYKEERNCYEDDLNQQVADVLAKRGEGNLDALLRGREVWEIK